MLRFGRIRKFPSYTLPMDILTSNLLISVSSGFRTNGSGNSFSSKFLTNLSSGAPSPITTPLARSYSSILQRTPSLVQNAVALRSPLASNWSSPSCKSLLLQPTNPSALCSTPPSVRTLTKFSRGNGKRKSVKAVLKRFMRLDWGGWIHTKSGRHKKLWKKSSAQKRRLRQHVFSNSSQSWLLDSMVTSFWRRPKHYVDDPYRPYHNREEFLATRRKG